MTDSFFVPVVGKLVRNIRTVDLPQVKGLSLQEWTGEIITVPLNSPLMFLSVKKGTSECSPYWKTYLLLGEQIVFCGSHEDEFEHIFKYVEM